MTKQIWDFTREEILSLSEEQAKKYISYINECRSADYGYSKELSASNFINDTRLLTKAIFAKKTLQERLGRRPWQLPYNILNRVDPMPQKRHKQFVEEAISEGKIIPQIVLNDYPELK